jgi:ABC-type molybdate transport system permease subunit
VESASRNSWKRPLTIAYTPYAIAIGLIYSYLPFMVLPIYATIERFDFRLVESAYDLYADRWTVLRRIVLPLAAPGIIAGCLLVFIPSLGAFIAPDILGGGRNLMIGNMIALQFGASRNWPFGAAAAVILMSMVLVALTSAPAPRSRAQRRCGTADAGACGQSRGAQAVSRLSRDRLVLCRLSLRADPGDRGLLLQQHPLDHRVGRIHPRLVRPGVPERRNSAGDAELAHGRGDRGQHATMARRGGLAMARAGSFRHTAAYAVINRRCWCLDHSAGDADLLRHHWHHPRPAHGDPRTRYSASALSADRSPPARYRLGHGEASPTSPIRRTFRHVTLPLMGPGVVVGFMLAFIISSTTSSSPT